MSLGNCTDLYMYAVPVSAVVYAIPFDIGPRYNGTPLYMQYNHTGPRYNGIQLHINAHMVHFVAIMLKKKWHYWVLFWKIGLLFKPDSQCRVD